MLPNNRPKAPKYPTYTPNCYDYMNTTTTNTSNSVDDDEDNDGEDEDEDKDEDAGSSSNTSLNVELSLSPIIEGNLYYPSSSFSVSSSSPQQEQQ